MTTSSRTDNKSNESLTGWSIRVRGTVQGVGFRPTVFKLATQYGIVGRVYNDGEGVLIEAWSSQPALQSFKTAISENAPPLAKIESIEHEPLSQSEIPASFSISLTESRSANTFIAADAATCPSCLEDTFSPFSRRFRYPFTNCTHCGPRLSIIKAIPYDRASTTMAAFEMCHQCKTEYDHPADRRFHAQPNACHACGPKAWLERSDSGTLCLESMTQLDWVDAATTLIQRGEIVAVKGIGGFHLACDATNEQAVEKLRARKKRYHKPFALMARDLDVVKLHCSLNDTERDLLQSRQAPIVVLKQLPPGDQEKRVARAVAPGQNSLGFMLPYTPLHHLMMRRLNAPIVLTSGNLSQEPQCTSNEDARERLSSIADYFLVHDREIANRLDDSVLRVVANRAQYLRRARGAAPAPIALPAGFNDIPEILALGGELKNTFCLLKNSKAILSQHIGDLEEARTLADFKHNLDLYLKGFRHDTSHIAIDLHPEYLSSKFGRALATEKNLSLCEVQHHHAHIAACLAENNWALTQGPVLGVALDGLGYGSDGSLWGGEFLLADYTSFERLGTFKPVALLGGSKAMSEPWRNTYAHIMAEMGWPAFKMNYEELELTKFLETKSLSQFESMLKSKVNSPLASSCGRLFDAVAAAMGICQDQASYEGQAAIELEAIADEQTLRDETDQLAYPFAIPRLAGKGIPYVEPLAVWQALLGDLYLKTSPAVMSARFHKGLAKVIVQMIDKLCTRDDEIWLNTIALTGGVFQNRIIAELVESSLVARGYNVLTHHQVPANDGGIALGQALIAAAQHLNHKKERHHVSWHTWANS
jgi:hydrogenase maturation protein HypF